MWNSFVKGCVDFADYFWLFRLISIRGWYFTILKIECNSSHTWLSLLNCSTFLLSVNFKTEIYNNFFIDVDDVVCRTCHDTLFMSNILQTIIKSKNFSLSIPCLTVKKQTFVHKRKACSLSSHTFCIVITEKESLESQFRKSTFPKSFPRGNDEILVVTEKIIQFNDLLISGLFRVLPSRTAHCQKSDHFPKDTLA